MATISDQQPASLRNVHITGDERYAVFAVDTLPAPQSVRLPWSERVARDADRFVDDRDVASGRQILDIPVAQFEPIAEPDGALNHLRRKSVPCIEACSACRPGIDMSYPRQSSSASSRLDAARRVRTRVTNSYDDGSQRTPVAKPHAASPATSHACRALGAQRVSDRIAVNRQAATSIAITRLHAHVRCDGRPNVDRAGGNFSLVPRKNAAS